MRNMVREVEEERVALPGVIVHEGLRFVLGHVGLVVVGGRGLQSVAGQLPDWLLAVQVRSPLSFTVGSPPIQACQSLQPSGTRVLYEPLSVGLSGERWGRCR